MNRHPDYLLNRVNEPADIKSMSLEQLKQLATEMRQLVLERDAAIGGHVGPNKPWNYGNNDCISLRF